MWLHYVVIASHMKIRSGRSLTWSLARVLGPSRNSCKQNFSCWYTVQGGGGCVTAQHLVVSLSDDRTALCVVCCECWGLEQRTSHALLGKQRWLRNVKAWLLCSDSMGFNNFQVSSTWNTRFKQVHSVGSQKIAKSALRQHKGWAIHKGSSSIIEVCCH
jgi:hypothetical protein